MDDEGVDVTGVVVGAVETELMGAEPEGTLSAFETDFLGDIDNTDDEKLTRGLFPRDPISDGVRSTLIRAIGI